MSLTRLPAELRRRAVTHRSLTPLQQRRHASSPLFHLAALSNSRETQHFNKATRLSRVEHSPALKLIQTSEVDPFVSPTLQGKRDVSTVPDAEKVSRGHGEAWESLPKSAQDEIWKIWSASDKTASLGELAEKSREARRLDANSAREGATAEKDLTEAELAEEWARSGHRVNVQPPSGCSNVLPLPEGAMLPPSSGGSGSGGDGKKPPGSNATADEKGSAMNEDALKIGKAFIGENMQKKRQLLQELKDAKADIKKLEKEANEFKMKYQAAGGDAGGGFIFGAFVLAAMLLWLSRDRTPKDLDNKGWLGVNESVNERIARLEKELKEARERVPDMMTKIKAGRVDVVEGLLSKLRQQSASEKQQLHTQAQKDMQQLRSDKDRQLAKLRAEKMEGDNDRRASTALAEAERRTKEDLNQKIKAHEARMEDWTRKAEDLKRAVEKEGSSVV